MMRLRGTAMLVVAIAMTGCRDDGSREVAMASQRALALTSDLQAGSARVVSTRNPFDGNTQALAEGKRLFTWMNCAGCHGALGGGAIGPPLRDAEWIYGDDPASIFQSIQQGRPNGMPAFGTKVPADDIWRLALYVTSLGESAKRSTESESVHAP